MKSLFMQEDKMKGQLNKIARNIEAGMRGDLIPAFLKKHNMEPVHIPWRHRYFWDGGLHCITLDLKRQGKKEDYFNGIYSIQKNR